MHSDASFRCRVCGVLNLDPPWGTDGRTPLYEFCPCCGVEHGYQDATPAAARRFRGDWIAAGAPWDEPSLKPEGWDLTDQLSYVPVQFL
jgi:hypothetical protein